MRNIPFYVEVEQAIICSTGQSRWLRNCTCWGGADGGLPAYWICSEEI